MSNLTLEKKRKHFAYANTGMCCAKAAKKFLEAYYNLQDAMNELNNLEDYFAMRCEKEVLPFTFFPTDGVYDGPNSDEISDQLLNYAEICSKVAVKATENYELEYGVSDANHISGEKEVRLIERNLLFFKEKDMPLLKE
jgi:hypothetical protein